MIYGLYLSANGMITQNMTADTIANNLANSSTQGFKRDLLTLRQRDPEVLRRGGAATFETQRNLLAIGGAVEGDRSFSIFSQGSLQPTGNRTDIALSGDGFFKYLDPNGRAYYSRAGALTLDAQGFLTGPNGFKLASVAGSPLQVEGRDFYFDDAGRLMVDGAETGQVSMVSVDRSDRLHKVGENLFEAQGEVAETTSEAQFRSGFLEASSVNAVREMAALIEAQRAYEANSRFIRIQDETLGKAVSEIAV